MMIHISTAAITPSATNGEIEQDSVGRMSTIVYRSRDDLFRVAVEDLQGDVLLDSGDGFDRATVILDGEGEIEIGDTRLRFKPSDVVVEQSPLSSRLIRTRGMRAVVVTRSRTSEEVSEGKAVLAAAGLGRGVLNPEWAWEGPGVTVLERARANPHHVPPDDEHLGDAVKHWEAFYKSPDEIIEAGYELFSGTSWNPPRDGYDGATVILKGRGVLETDDRQYEFGPGDILIHACPISEKHWRSLDATGYEAAYVTRFRNIEIVKRWRYTPEKELLYS